MSRFISGINPGAGWAPAGPVGGANARAPGPGVRRKLADELGDFLLTDEAVGRIDFRLGVGNERVHVTGAKLRSVGHRLQVSALALVVDDAKLEERGAGATYHPGNETFTFRGDVMFSEAEIEEMPEAMARMVRGSVFRGDALTCGLVVHEAVHALLGAEGRALIRLVNETAAYLAECLWHVLRGSYDFLDRHSGGTRIYARAHDIIVAHGLAEKRGAHVPRREYLPLLRLIQADPLYRGLGFFERERRWR